MPTAADDFHDRSLRHQIALLRYADGLRTRLIAALNKGDAPLIRELREQLEALGDVSPAGYAKSSREVERRIKAIIETRDPTWTEFRAGLIAELQELAADEASFVAEALKISIPVEGVKIIEVAAEKVGAAIFDRPFEGRLLKDWADSLRASERTRLESAIRQGIIEGRTIDELVREVRGTRANQYTDGILNISRRNAEAVVRTAVAHTSHTSRDIVFEANSDIVAGKKLVATLDGRTTVLCMGRDGKVVINPEHKGEIPANLPLLQPQNAQLPFHFGCRSIFVVIFSLLEIEKQAGTRPFVRDTATGKRRQVNFRKEAKAAGMSLQDYREKWYRENVGQVPAGVNYDTWLRRQPAAFQDDVLGPGKAEIFRQGRKLDRFVDASGRELTLAELRSSR